MGLGARRAGRQPVAPVRLGDLGREAVEEAAASSTQRGRRAELLDVDLGLEIGRPEVAVDEPGEVLVEPEREEEVVAGDGIRNRDLALAADGERVGRLRASSPSRSAVAGQRPHPLARAPCPRSSPTNGIPWRSTASRLIRSADVFASATSRT